MPKKLILPLLQLAIFCQTALNQRNDTGIISDAVNTASRMEGLTKIFGTSILLSGNTLEKISQPDHFATRFLGKVQVKGKEKTVMLYECFNGDNEQSFHLKKETLETFNEALSTSTKEIF